MIALLKKVLPASLLSPRKGLPYSVSRSWGRKCQRSSRSCKGIFSSSSSFCGPLFTSYISKCPQKEQGTGFHAGHISTLRKVKLSPCIYLALLYTARSLFCPSIPWGEEAVCPPWLFRVPAFQEIVSPCPPFCSCGMHLFLMFHVAV